MLWGISESNLALMSDSMKITSSFSLVAMLGLGYAEELATPNGIFASEK
jgi:hypothetical protein